MPSLSLIIGQTQAFQCIDFAPASATPFACATELRVPPQARHLRAAGFSSHLPSSPFPSPILILSVPPTSPISRPLPLPDLGPGLGLGYAREMRNGRTTLLTSHNRPDICFCSVWVDPGWTWGRPWQPGSTMDEPGGLVAWLALLIFNYRPDASFSKH